VIPHFRVVVPSVVESYPEVGTASKVARLWARRKADAVASLKDSKGAFILAADTVVARQRQLFTTPETAEQAASMLACFDGRRFTITTALCLIMPDRVSVTHQTTWLKFGRLGEEARAAYIASNAWQKRAAGLDLAGAAGVFVRAMNGSWSSALGLPLWHTRELLISAGVDPQELLTPHPPNKQRRR